MVPAVSSTSLSSTMLEGLRGLLSYPKTPWNMSSTLFQRLQEGSDTSFKSCVMQSTDPEFAFILKYFEHSKPVGYSIKRVVCVHNPDHTQVFELTLKNMEREANNPVFTPASKQEEPKIDRARALSRWEAQASQFSPVEVKSLKDRADSCVRARVLPLWHGSSGKVCQSICTSGFTYFGKQHFHHESAQAGNNASTDQGYFGSGIYFTNSAHYASMYAEGHLLLTWVSMREPYPVVSDVPHPKKCTDMIKLGGQKHYQNYNAHYIPVASIEPNNPHCMKYYPCYKDQPPAWDELVVFEKAQTLPRFWVELMVDSPSINLSQLVTNGDLLTFVYNLLENPEVKSNITLTTALQKKADYLLEQLETTPLDAADDKFYKLAKRLIAEGGKINSSVLNTLLGTASPATSSTSSPIVSRSSSATALSLESASQDKLKKEKKHHKKEKKEKIRMENHPIASSTPSPISVVSVVPIALPKPSIPSMAFGKEAWAKYIGDVGIEPPLPADIHQILQSPCPFFHGKRVQETHLLTLIPKTVNGKSFTLNYLKELVKHPKQGQSTGYSFYWIEIKEQYGKTPALNSYWALFTKDVIPDSRDKKYEDQEQLLKRLAQKAKAPYEVPRLLEAATSVLMEYLRSGIRLYKDTPCTFTSCSETVTNEPNWTLDVGGFGADGLKIGNHSYLRGGGIGGLRKL